MNLSRHIKPLLFACFLAGSLNAFCQDTSAVKYSSDFLDSLRISYHFPEITTTVNFSQLPPYYLNREAQYTDWRNLKRYGYLVNQQPDAKNYDQYISLAGSLWEINRLKQAEKMFLTIMGSKEKHYSNTYYHSSDIPGDKTTNIYGYGSCTSNYKNTAALYLTKIYIVQKKFDKALHYLQEAVSKYKVSYNCGTGYRMQKDEYDFLYACCYEGLENYKAVMELLLPECISRNCEVLTRVIKKIYSPEQIKDYLLKGENSIQYTVDTFPSQSFVTTSGSDGKPEKEDTLTYYTGDATMNLFDTVVNLERPSLKNGERVTREHFVKQFKESSFYIELAEAAGISKETDNGLLQMKSPDIALTNNGKDH